MSHCDLHKSTLGNYLSLYISLFLSLANISRLKVASCEISCLIFTLDHTAFPISYSEFFLPSSCSHQNLLTIEFISLQTRIGMFNLHLKHYSWNSTSYNNTKRVIYHLHWSRVSTPYNSTKQIIYYSHWNRNEWKREF